MRPHAAKGSKAENVMRCTFAAMLLTCSAVALPTAAQTNSNPGSQLVIYPFDANTPAYSPPDVEHLLGDPWDVRSYLENHGIYLRLNATAEFAGNVSGGHETGSYLREPDRLSG